MDSMREKIGTPEYHLDPNQQTDALEKRIAKAGDVEAARHQLDEELAADPTNPELIRQSKLLDTLNSKTIH